ncbi:hypothetical protein [Kutzneria sp. CA-103260]|uniref:hypothetical protein n=1 Tax=Kutzneria sp. CA-103260 TaxID=2802641 RepID=UPI001BA65B46|nr:hypothetical protein [Kutzneria sp. CA-103260]QUQ66293.1 hypothetical protein JJ691_40200 [Kutzneria sp. CA-103260]
MSTSSDRPSVSAPDALSPEALADARQGQPRRGLLGLLFVVPAAVLLAVGWGGPVHTFEVLGPLLTFALPIVAVIAFWWQDWPGSLLSGGWSGLGDTAIVAAGGVVLTLLGQGLLEGIDLQGVFARGASVEVPLAVAIFGVILQLTLVGECWPLRGLSRIWSGLAALVLCWLVGLSVYSGLVGTGSVTGEVFASWFAALGVWQMVWYVALRGWPFARIRRRAVRLVTAHLSVLACGWISYLVAERVLGWEPGRIAEVSGSAIAAILVIAMLFEAWPTIRLTVVPGRSIMLVLMAVLTAILAVLLPLVAAGLGLSDRQSLSWSTHATLNALSLAVILHVAVWRRWLAD